MDVWVANVSGVVAWLLKRGLAREDYRRLGVKLAVVQDHKILYSKLMLSDSLKQFYIHHFGQLSSIKHNKPCPSTLFSSHVQRCTTTDHAQMDPVTFCDRHRLRIGNECSSSPLPLTALCMDALHCCMHLFAKLHPHGVYAVLLREQTDRCELCMSAEA